MIMIPIEEETKLIEMYNQNYSFSEIAEALEVSPYAIKSRVKVLLASGKIEHRENIRVYRAEEKRRAEREEKAAKERKAKIPHPNGGVYCDKACARKCIYGCPEGKFYLALCNYRDIEGKLRGCDPHDCTKFVPITKDNPRRISKYDI